MADFEINEDGKGTYEVRKDKDDPTQSVLMRTDGKTAAVVIDANTHEQIKFATNPAGNPVTFLMRTGGSFSLIQRNVDGKPTVDKLLERPIPTEKQRNFTIIYAPLKSDDVADNTRLVIKDGNVSVKTTIDKQINFGTIEIEGGIADINGNYDVDIKNGEKVTMQGGGNAIVRVEHRGREWDELPKIKFSGAKSNSLRVLDADGKNAGIVTIGRGTKADLVDKDKKPFAKPITINENGFVSIDGENQGSDLRGALISYYNALKTENKKSVVSDEGEYLGDGSLAPLQNDPVKPTPPTPEPVKPVAPKAAVVDDYAALSKVLRDSMYAVRGQNNNADAAAYGAFVGAELEAAKAHNTDVQARKGANGENEKIPLRGPTNRIDKIKQERGPFMAYSIQALGELGMTATFKSGGITQSKNNVLTKDEFAKSISSFEKLYALSMTKREFEAEKQNKTLPFDASNLRFEDARDFNGFVPENNQKALDAAKTVHERLREMFKNLKNEKGLSPELKKAAGLSINAEQPGVKPNPELQNNRLSSFAEAVKYAIPGFKAIEFLMNDAKTIKSPAANQFAGDKLIENQESKEIKKS